MEEVTSYTAHHCSSRDQQDQGSSKSRNELGANGETNTQEPHQQDTLSQDLNSVRMATGPIDTPRQGIVMNNIQAPVRSGRRQGSDRDSGSILEARLEAGQETKLEDSITLEIIQ